MLLTVSGADLECVMATIISVDSIVLKKNDDVTAYDVDLNGYVHPKESRLCVFKVISGGVGWPTPYEIAIHIGTDLNTCIIEWPRPCLPIKFTVVALGLNYGEFVLHLDTATADEILAANEVNAQFFRDD